MLATPSSSLQRRGLLSAALLFAVATAQTVGAQDYNYPPQQGSAQPNYGQQGDPSQVDPPSRVARVSVLQGNVSLQPSGVEDFSQASLNYPLTSGDRIYSDNGSTAELEAGQLALRLGSATDLSVTSMTDQFEQFGLGQGSVHVRSYDLDPNATLEIDTPNVSITVLAPGDLRIDVSPDGNMTQVTLLSGQARVDGPNFQQQLQPGESLQLTGNEPLYAQDARRPRGDGLDRFSSDRDRVYQDAIVTQTDYVNPATIGAADLGQYGDWSNDADNGPVWYPRSVAADWQPYSYGRWAYVAPWGWTWVENEPWGFAPFHYGRWARFGPRWGWIPGPRVVRPVYSPALVAFVGGGGASVTAWFPLGPREPYVPWYRTSSLYANRINVSNIYSRNTVEVRNIYNQRTTNVYVNNNTFNRNYANRQLATVAIPQNAFAGGRPVREVAMHLPPQQFANGPLLSRPNATPTRQIMVSAPARALPPRMQRPPVEARGAGGFQPGGSNHPDRGGFSDRNGWNGGGNRGTSGNQPGNVSGSQGNNGGGNYPGRGRDPQQPGTPPAQGGAQVGGQYGNMPVNGGPVPPHNPFGQNPQGSQGQNNTGGKNDSGRGGNNPPSGRGTNNNPQQPGTPPAQGGAQQGGQPGNLPVSGGPVPSRNPFGQNPQSSQGQNGGGSNQSGRGSNNLQQPGGNPQQPGTPPVRGDADPGRTNNMPVRGTPVYTTDPSLQFNRGNNGAQGAPSRPNEPPQQQGGSAPSAPVNQQPLRAFPGQGDIRPRSGAHAIEMPPQDRAQPPSNPRQWQQQPANRPEQAAPQPQPQRFQPQPQQPQPQPQRLQPQPQPQQPRFQPQPAPAQQPQRQFTPQQPQPRPAAPAPAATPNEHPHGR